MFTCTHVHMFNIMYILMCTFPSAQTPLRLITCAVMFAVCSFESMHMCHICAIYVPYGNVPYMHMCHKWNVQFGYVPYGHVPCENVPYVPVLPQQGQMKPKYCSILKTDHHRYHYPPPPPWPLSIQHFLQRENPCRVELILLSCTLSVWWPTVHSIC